MSRYEKPNRLFLIFNKATYMTKSTEGCFQYNFRKLLCHNIYIRFDRRSVITGQRNSWVFVIIFSSKLFSRCWLYHMPLLLCQFGYEESLEGFPYLYVNRWELSEHC